MNALFKIALWVLVYAVLGVTLYDGIRLLIRAAKSHIIKPRMNKRAAADIIGAATAAICAVYAFIQSTVCDIGSMIAGWGEIMSYITDEYEELSAFADMFPRDSTYYAAVYKCVGAFAVVLCIYLLFCCFGRIGYITESGVIYRGMIKPEEIITDIRDGKIAVYYKVLPDSKKPQMTLKATPKNLEKLERFVEKEDRQDMFVVGG